MTVKLIVAYDDKRGIGRRGKMPWHIPGESKWTSTVTRSARSGRRNALIMGRHTYFSIPEKRRPLPDRINIVMTSRDCQIESDVYLAGDFDKALHLTETIDHVDDVFIFGGAQIYQQALNRRVADELIISEVKGDYGCDAFFPEIPAGYGLNSSATVTYGAFEVRHAHYVRR